MNDDFNEADIWNSDWHPKTSTRDVPAYALLAVGFIGGILLTAWWVGTLAGVW